MILNFTKLFALQNHSLALSLFVLVIMGCSSNNSKNQNDQYVSDNEGGKDTLLSQSDDFIKRPSLLDRLIDSLIIDQYEIAIDTIKNQTIFFISYSNLIDNKSNDTLRIEAAEIITLTAKRQKPIRNTNLFPRLKIQRITPNDSFEIKEIKGKIESIIYNRDDIINEKEYDRIQIHKDNVYYLTTNAKVFEDYVVKYNEELVKMINAR